VSLVLQILVAGALIAVFVVLRISSDRRVQEQRRQCIRADDGHGGGNCHGGCGGHGPAAESGDEKTESNLQRST
jgi:hypothetical protein